MRILRTRKRKEEENGGRKGALVPPLRPGERRFRAVAAIGIVAALAGAALLPLALPSGVPVLPSCVFKSATGLPCPLCGGTRAAQALLHGDLSRALYLNAVALPAVAGLVAVALVLGWEAFRGRSTGYWNSLLRRLRSLLPVMAVFLCLYWIFHLTGALRGMKSELLDLRNPIARAAYERFSDRAR